MPPRYITQTDLGMFHGLSDCVGGVFDTVAIVRLMLSGSRGTRIVLEDIGHHFTSDRVLLLRLLMS